MSELGIGLIGSGFMGASHAFALAAVGQVFDLPKKPRLELLADASTELAEIAARRFGFARATADWQATTRQAGTRSARQERYVGTIAEFNNLHNLLRRFGKDHHVRAVLFHHETVTFVDQQIGTR